MSVKLPAGISPETLHIRYNAKDVDPRYLAWKGNNFFFFLFIYLSVCFFFFL